MGCLSNLPSPGPVSQCCSRIVETSGARIGRWVLSFSGSSSLRPMTLRGWRIVNNPIVGLSPSGHRSLSRKLDSRTIFAADVPDFLPAIWTKRPEDKPIGPSFDLTAEEATLRQLDALQDNDTPYPDHGVEVMYRFAGFDPFKRSEYFGPFFDLGQFERFRRIFHHSTYRVLLCHTERQILSSLYVNERVGGNWDGYWLTDSLRPDANGITGGIAY